MKRFRVITEYKIVKSKAPNLKIIKTKIPINYRIADLQKPTVGHGSKWYFETLDKAEADAVCRECNILDAEDKARKAVRN